MQDHPAIVLPICMPEYHPSMITYATPLQPTKYLASRCVTCCLTTVRCKAPGCIRNGLPLLIYWPPTWFPHAPLTNRQLSVRSPQGYFFPSKPFSFDTCKYTKGACFCQGNCLYSLTTYCNKVLLRQYKIWFQIKQIAGQRLLLSGFQTNMNWSELPHNIPLRPYFYHTQSTKNVWSLYVSYTTLLKFNDWFQNAEFIIKYL